MAEGEPAIISGKFPLVSIVMPVRDGAEFLEDAVASILGQTFRDFEFLIIDDSSGPTTRDLLVGIAGRDPRITVVGCEGAGIVDALNQGIAMARASIIARMDGDDIAHPDRLEKQLAHFETRPSLAVLGTSYAAIDKAGRHLETVLPPTDAATIRSVLTSRNCIAHPTVMMKREPFEAVGGYRRAFAHCEDFDLWVRLVERYELENLPDVLLRYRRHEGQATWRSLEARLLGEVAIFKSAEARASGHHDFGVDRAFISIERLQSAGMSIDLIRDAILVRALEAATNALNAGQNAEARMALQIAGRHGAWMPGLSGRYWRLQIKRLLAAYQLTGNR